jgi:hypothetical protein
MSAKSTTRSLCLQRESKAAIPFHKESLPLARNIQTAKATHSMALVLAVNFLLPFSAQNRMSSPLST